MLIVPKRLGVKFSLKREPQLQPDDIVPIFQRWIQQHTVEGMLIDVIDYKHVPAGPGIVLIADEADYAYDLTDGQIGLYYLRKRALPADLAGALRLAFHCALKAARALEVEAPGDIEFDYGSAKITFLDRMHYRNQPQIFDDLRDALTEIQSGIFGAPVEITRLYEDPRQVCAIQCRVGDEAVDIEDILTRLQERWQAV